MITPQPLPDPLPRLSVRVARRIDAVRGRRTILGVRVLLDGARLQGARVSFAGRTAITNAEGLARFRLRLRRGGIRTVVIHAPGASPMEVPLRVRVLRAK